MHLGEESRAGQTSISPRRSFKKTIRLGSGEFPLDTDSFWSCIE